MSEKITVAEFKDKVYEEFKDEINLISKASEETREEGNWKADIGVSTDLFIEYVDNSEGRGLFVNIDKVKARLAELRAMIQD